MELNAAAKIALSGTPGRATQLSFLSLNDGRDNSFVGKGSGTYFPGRDNTFLGTGSGANVRSAQQCVLTGAGSGNNADRMVDVVAIGAGSARGMQDAYNCVLVGGRSGEGMQRSGYSTMVGFGSGMNTSSATRSTAVGALAGYTSATLLDSTLVGVLAGACPAGSTSPAALQGVTAVGYQALYNNATAAAASSSGAFNTIVGYRCGTSMQGGRNTMVGAECGAATHGSQNVVVGANIGQALALTGNTATMNNCLFVGANISYSPSSQLNSSVYLGHSFQIDETETANTFLVSMNGTRIMKANTTSLEFYGGGNQVYTAPSYSTTVPSGSAGIAASGTSWNGTILSYNNLFNDQNWVGGLAVAKGGVTISAGGIILNSASTGSLYAARRLVAGQTKYDPGMKDYGLWVTGNAKFTANVVATNMTVTGSFQPSTFQPATLSIGNIVSYYEVDTATEPPKLVLAYRAQDLPLKIVSDPQVGHTFSTGAGYTPSAQTDFFFTGGKVHANVVGSGADLTDMSANNITSGTLDASLVTISNLPNPTSINANSITSGTLDASLVTISNLLVPRGSPVGMIAYFPSLTLPSGWLACDGAAVSRVSYAALFALLGVAYGAGDGQATFNVPDLQGEFIRCLDQTRGIDPGRTVGNAQTQSFQTHSHSITAFNTSVSGSFLGWYTGSGQNNTSAKSTNATGTSETRPRNIALLACICATS